MTDEEREALLDAEARQRLAPLLDDLHKEICLLQAALQEAINKGQHKGPAGNTRLKENQARAAVALHKGGQGMPVRAIAASLSINEGAIDAAREILAAGGDLSEMKDLPLSCYAHELRQLLRNGMPNSKIKRRLSVSPATVQKFINANDSVKTAAANDKAAATNAARAAAIDAAYDKMHEGNTAEERVSACIEYARLSGLDMIGRARAHND